jgi:predicted ester cyclase
MSEAADNLELRRASRRLLEEGYGEGRLGVVDELCDPGVRVEDPALAGDLHGPTGMKASMEALRRALPDVSVEVEQQAEEEGWIVSRFRLDGTHDGEVLGIAEDADEHESTAIPPTGRAVAVRGKASDRFEDGKHVERVLQWDDGGLLGAIGLLPAVNVPSEPGGGGGARGFPGAFGPGRPAAPGGMGGAGRVPPPNPANPLGRPPQPPRPVVPGPRPPMVKGPLEDHPVGVPWRLPARGGKPLDGPF